MILQYIFIFSVKQYKKIISKNNSNLIYKAGKPKLRIYSTSNNDISHNFKYNLHNLKPNGPWNYA